jgi:hypothetical protein
MTNAADLRLQPDEITDATRMLDELAGRAEKVMNDEAANLAVTAAGRDEVSRQVATTLNDVHTAYGDSANRAISRMRDMSAALRAHTGNVVEADQDFLV